jgi:hypothetical protein
LHHLIIGAVSFVQEPRAELNRPVINKPRLLEREKILIGTVGGMNVSGAAGIALFIGFETHFDEKSRDTSTILPRLNATP